MSGVGGQLHAVALPFLVLGAGLGARTLGTVLAACGVARAGEIALGGPLTDRLGPRRVMLAADGLRAVLVALLARAGHPSLSVLVVVAVPLGAGQGAVGPGLGGLLVGRVGPGLALVGDALVHRLDNLLFGRLLDVAMPDLVRGRFHAGPAGYGLIPATFSVGAPGSSRPCWDARCRC